MLSRRTFIKSTLVSNIALLAEPTLALTVNKSLTKDTPLLVFADEQSNNAQQFAQQFNLQESPINLDVGKHFHTFKQFCDDNTGGWISGLTRDSDYFVLQQLAADKGLHTAYSANHISSESGISHHVSSSTGKAPLIASSLAGANEQWPQWLANNINSLAHHEAAYVNASSQSTSHNHTHEYLVSWLFIQPTSL